MRGSDNIATMADAIAQFEAQVQRLALDIVQAVIRQELERVAAPFERSVKLEAARAAKRGPAPKAAPAPVQKSKRKAAAVERVPQLELQLAKAAERQLDLDLRQQKRAAAAEVAAPPPAAPAAPAAPAPTTESVESASPAPSPPAPAAAPSPAPAAPQAAQVNGRKRTQWTREAIVHELASWMSKGTAIDAQFMTRHGPRGLVAATRRIFGRFDAALNVAALHVSKMQPEEPTSELS